MLRECKSKYPNRGNIWLIDEKGLLEIQDHMRIDAVSGATYSLYHFRYVLTKALFEAQQGIK